MHTAEAKQPGLAWPPRVVAGRYRLGPLIGEGGMGAVYQAEHLGLEAQVAVKLLNEGALGDHKALARFRREARAMGAFRHENVVSVLDAGSDERDGSPYLVMELLDGESLSTVLRRRRRLEPATACWVATQVLAGLAAAHGRGVVHRDLKAGNVFITRQLDGTHRVKILDFGVSKLLGSSTLDVTANGAVVGTPNCMAPEQLTGEVDSDPRIDLYAVGVLLYRMVTGRLPFKGSTADAIFRQIQEGPIRPRRHDPGIPPALEAVILRAMDPEPSQRFQSAAAMRSAALRCAPELAEGTMPTPEVIAARRPEPPKEPRPERREPKSVVSPTESEPVPRPMILPDGTGPTIPAHRAALEDRSIPSLRPRRGPIALAILGALALLLLGFFAYAELQSRSAAAAAPPPLRFGVVRYLPADLVKGAQRPVVDYLALQLEREVELVIAEDDRDLEEKLRSGEVHAAALSPYAYVRVRERMPDLSLLATPVVSGGASTYEGYILSRVESDVRELEDLRGRVFCFVRPDSTSGYLYPRAALRRAGIDPDRDFLAIRFGGDHLETLRQLARGACDGAAVYGGAWFGAREHGVAPESFRLLGGTDRIPLDAYVAAPDLTEDEATALREAFLALEPQSPAAHRHLGGESNVIGFAAARDSAYDPVRRLARSSVDEDERQRASNRAR